MGYFTCGQRTRLGSRLLSNSVPELPPTATHARSRASFRPSALWCRFHVRNYCIKLMEHKLNLINIQTEFFQEKRDLQKIKYPNNLNSAVFK